MYVKKYQYFVSVYSIIFPARRTPFNIRFLSDQYEIRSTGAGSEGAVDNPGFKLVFIQSVEDC